MTNNEKMQHVIKLARYALNQGELPIASIIYNTNDIVAQDYTTENRDKRHLVHAEIKVLLEVDKYRFAIKDKKSFQLFTNLEPCMMCLGGIASSFIGNLFYSINSPTDGAVIWAEETWNIYHRSLFFKLPVITSGLMIDECKELFREYIKIHKKGTLVEWARTLI